MTRIASLPVDQWDKELRELAQADTLPTVQQTMLGVYANAPELAKAFVIFTGAMSQGFTLRRRLPENEFFADSFTYAAPAEAPA